MIILFDFIPLQLVYIQYIYFFFQVNVLYDANVPPSTFSKIMSTLCEDDKGTFLPKTIFIITEKNKSLLNMAIKILQSMTKAEKVIWILTT